jgi:cytochrome c
MLRIEFDMVIRTMAAAVGLTILPMSVFAAPPSKETAGLKLAQQYCARCHRVAPTAARGWTDAPAFEDVANRPNSTVEGLQSMIEKPHMKMLNTQRPPAEANELATYIMSLRKHQH